MQKSLQSLSVQSTLIEILTLAMRHMCLPEDGNLVPGTRQPAITKIEQRDCCWPACYRAPPFELWRDQKLRVHQREQTDVKQRSAYGNRLAQHSLTETSDGVIDAIGLPSGFPATRTFDRDQHSKDGQAEQQKLNH